jgi:hypothetical protein
MRAGTVPAVGVKEEHQMKRYLLGIYQREGEAPPPAVLEDLESALEWGRQATLSMQPFQGVVED